ncbi:MAG: UDP-N-acetylmuramate--L-alanine ligase [Clostridia bacterium]|nr:UDP-N-acetylmuramate--L-alanine ligase [Clostridia bacterium]
MNIDDLLQSIHRVHFIGIGGSGMTPLAEILLSNGYTLTGSDNNPGDNIDKLRGLGAEIVMGQKAENLELLRPELIVDTAAILPDNPELVAAKESGIPCCERAELFGAISRMYDNCICICGTHGKTTTTSMMSQIMVEAGTDPTLVIGGRLPLIDSHGRAGKSRTMVAEACEFKDHFLTLSPDTTILLNVDDDHMEYFKTMDNVIASYTKFLNMTTNLVIYNGDDENTRKVIERADHPENKKFLSFGLDPENDYTADHITYVRGAFPEFDVLRGGEYFLHVRLNVPGTHNVFNALGVIAAAVENGVSPKDIETYIEHFSGAGRRFEVLGEYHGITIADDYAHHPTELTVTLEAVMKMGYHSVWAVFQPFTYSRTYLLMDEFAKALQIPDHAVLTEIMGSRERNTYNVYSSQLCEKIPGSVWFNTFDEVVDSVKAPAQEGELILTLGCGDMYTAATMMVARYQDQ